MVQPEQKICRWDYASNHVHEGIDTARMQSVLQKIIEHIDEGPILAYSYLQQIFVANATGGLVPIYDYYCGKCDRSVELLIRGSTIPVCPTCGSDQLEKLVSKPAPHGKTKGIVAEARKQAAREGHFSNYSKSELAKQK